MQLVRRVTQDFKYRCGVFWGRESSPTPCWIPTMLNSNEESYKDKGCFYYFAIVFFVLYWLIMTIAAKLWTTCLRLSLFFGLIWVEPSKVLSFLVFLHFYVLKYICIAGKKQGVILFNNIFVIFMWNKQAHYLSCSLLYS